MKIKIFQILSFLILFGFQSFYAQEVNSADSYGFIGAAFSSRDMTDGTIKGLLSEKPSYYELNYTGYRGMLGGRLGIYSFTGNVKYNLGSIKQTGAFFDLLGRIEVPSEYVAVNIYAGPGIVYQSSEVYTSFDGDTAKNGGVGFSYVGGIDIIFNRRFVVFGEYRGISSKAGSAQVGSTGLSLGIRYGILIK